MGLLDIFKRKTSKQTESSDNKESTDIAINTVNVFWKKFQDQLVDFFDLGTIEAIERSNKLLNELFPHIRIEFQLDKSTRSFNKIILSANGYVKEFQSVMQLVEGAPKIQGAEIVAFRQRVAMNLDDFEMAMEDFKLACKDILIHATCYKGRINIAIAFNKTIDQDKIDHAKQMTFIILDHVLGEYDFAVKIGSIQFVEETASYTFIALPHFMSMFDKMWAEELGHTQLFPSGETTLHVFEAKDKETQDVVIVGQLNQSAKSIVCRADFGIRLDVIIEVSNKSVFETLYKYEDELTQYLETQQTGIFALALLFFNDGKRTSTWYVTDEKQAVQMAQQLASKYSSLVLSIEASYDPLWDNYLAWYQ